MGVFSHLELYELGLVRATYVTATCAWAACGAAQAQLMPTDTCLHILQVAVWLLTCTTFETLYARLPAAGQTQL